MNKKLFKTTLFAAAIALSTIAACTKNDGPNGENPSAGSGPDTDARQFITLTAAFPDAVRNRAGDGGTLAYALTLAEASDASKELNIFANGVGYPLRSERTARVQGSVNGNFLYNIQYTGTNGGVFNKYRVGGTNKFEDTNEELNVATILSASPRWVKAAEGVGVGVKLEGASAPIDDAKAAAGTQTYDYVRGTVDVAIIDLNNPSVPNTTEFTFPFTDAEKAAGYSVGRVDVPVINGNKVYIGCNIAKVDPSKGPQRSVNSETQEVNWSWADDAANIKGTVTLVLDYPSLANPTLIWSTQSKSANHSYRTMTQYVGSDGNVYQATANSGSQILRISKSTSDYDNSYNFDLKTALNKSNNLAIKAWKYLGDSKGLVLFTETGVTGGYMALVDLNARTANQLSTEISSDTGLSATFGQFQNIGVDGDLAYVPLTPSGKDGNLYIVNWKTGSVTKGIRLKGQTGSFFIGAY